MPFQVNSYLAKFKVINTLTLPKNLSEKTAKEIHDFMIQEFMIVLSQHFSTTRHFDTFNVYNLLSYLLVLILIYKLKST